MQFADASNGDDKNGDGSLSKPFQSVSRALDAARASGGHNPSIVLREGTYYMAETLDLTASDSGLTIQNYNGEQVWISG